ncbi:alpha/beta-hydrolase [Rhizoclosmatium globosum]|uniref:Alpha/beta-hydrolase n=1 Tax=Rhizoclosmatium globosum TaxID=329046 RepID=A0A1Y2C408_9FUNG|nr:alpha/beta-hydrolase [Rhizoclosmatium globosum]|eukprot:ORY41627.1 alpha/beta-hydrolase [Rhizoclosmatium globosum]
MATTPEINRAYQEYVTKVEQTVNDKRIAWQPSWTLPYLISMTVAKRLVYSVRNNVVAGKLVLSNFKQPKPIHVGIKQVKVPRRKDYLLFDMDTSQAEGVVPGEWCDSSVKFDPCHPAEKVVLYAHGGVYIGGSRKTHRQLTWRIAKDAGARILSIDYRLAPEHKFPLALHDMLSCYLYLIDPPAGMPKYQPEQIFFAGDSSGGNLALVTALYIRDHCDKIPLPGGLILLNVLPSRSFDKKHLGPEDSIYHVPSHLPITDPMISPLFAKEISEKPLPPVLIQVGSCERLHDEALRLFSEQFPTSQIRMEIYDELLHMFHIFCMVQPLAREAVRNIGRFVKDVGSDSMVRSNDRISANLKFKGSEERFTKVPFGSCEEYLKRQWMEVETVLNQSG